MSFGSGTVRAVDKGMKKVENQISYDYCGAELKNYPFFYKLGDFVGEDLICAVALMNISRVIKGRTGFANTILKR